MRLTTETTCACRVVGADDGYGIVAGLVLRWGTGMTELYAYSQANSTLFGPLIAKDTTTATSESSTLTCNDLPGICAPKLSDRR